MKGPAGTFIDDLMAMAQQGKFKDKKAWAEYILLYIKNAGLDAHVYLGDRSNPEKPGFFINKKVSSGAVDFHFKGPADITRLANFAMAKENYAEKLVAQASSEGKCVV